MKASYAVLVIGLLIVGSVLWLGRYELVPSAEGLVAYRLDRWTGQVRFYNKNGWKDINLSSEQAAAQGKVIP